MNKLTVTSVTIDPSKRDLAKIMGLNISKMLDNALNEKLALDGFSDAREALIAKRIELKMEELNELKGIQKGVLSEKKRKEQLKDKDMDVITEEANKIKSGQIDPNFDADIRWRMLNKGLANKITFEEYNRVIGR